MASVSIASPDRLGAFVFGTRGFYLLVAQIGILWLKHASKASIPGALNFGMLAAILLTQVLRTWAAGFVGTLARQPITGAPEFLTAGPYRLSEGIANEVAAWIGIGVFLFLHAVLYKKVKGLSHQTPEISGTASGDPDRKGCP